jgi:hypothetical protein
VGIANFFGPEALVLVTAMKELTSQNRFDDLISFVAELANATGARRLH